MNDIGNKNDKETVQNKNLIFVPRWMQFIVIIDKCNLHKVSQKLNTTHSHAVKIMQTLINENYIYKVKDPSNMRANKIYFTEKGLRLQSHVKDMLEVLNKMPDTSDTFFEKL